MTVNGGPAKPYGVFAKTSPESLTSVPSCLVDPEHYHLPWLEKTIMIICLSFWGCLGVFVLNNMIAVSQVYEAGLWPNMRCNDTMIASTMIGSASAAIVLAFTGISINTRLARANYIGFFLVFMSMPIPALIFSNGDIDSAQNVEGGHRAKIVTSMLGGLGGMMSSIAQIQAFSYADLMPGLQDPSKYVAFGFAISSFFVYSNSTWAMHYLYPDVTDHSQQILILVHLAISAALLPTIKAILFEALLWRLPLFRARVANGRRGAQNDIEAALLSANSNLSTTTTDTCNEDSRPPQSCASAVAVDDADYGTIQQNSKFAVQPKDQLTEGFFRRAFYPVLRPGLPIFVTYVFVPSIGPFAWPTRYRHLMLGIYQCSDIPFRTLFSGPLFMNAKVTDLMLIW
eukprot:CAMPEP_0113844324 /NCGR_PEP_ID=MMETSP0372-20130328/181_1 /TAXON_ID=340204 /ORGANISM="Lankesteria abbotti" /LENGTH=398 /DNA_ID=CAMNT_0000813329 /DNA_START=72 /DNA_END=1265 /DNA_ORIENTATION=+ /assembly_acc=CAM_ASM_000359